MASELIDLLVLAGLAAQDAEKKRRERELELQEMARKESAQIAERASEELNRRA